ncbi:hypothetical protein HA72_0754 [Metallosphaera sedula]|uniref:Uncharacterized protein n=3 Tax=Metallosphaera TaxID=41980 RepID=A4YES7_METS5|nr:MULTISPECIES: hypothetical protein [Metallosphaera]ABP94929.1 hypothetical protein Msed_0754 [Metallosphaera sedula DSM 5348]AIM26916.1 hypothetical protein HA72_0754 [Metallosphaera sedula]AKV73849.1 hypothetical protein MsedA_0769 [Metallosphaera sedula]AKV76090.1 hypothetical protein MsedB_0769 [Metallosphaera sedula]AKV78341.1 hypothetical protein MsedC_0768 [Metallosphaera sedula]
MRLRQPPRIKVLEALGAIADQRVRKVDNHYEVISSEGDRKYTVSVEGNNVSSDDNGTRFRNYVGYPIIAVLMLEGRLPYDEELAKALAGIPWRKLNEEMKDYSKVEEIVLKRAEEKGVKRERIEDFVNRVMENVRRLGLNKVT